MFVGDLGGSGAVTKFRAVIGTCTDIVTRRRTLRVPARNGYPPNFGARILPYPPGNEI